MAEEIIAGLPYQFTTNEAESVYGTLEYVFNISVLFWSVLIFIIVLMVTITTSQVIIDFYKATRRKKGTAADNYLMEIRGVGMKQQRFEDRPERVPLMRRDSN